MEIVYSDANKPLINPLDIHKEKKKSGSVEIDKKQAVFANVGLGATAAIDAVSWLPFASKPLNISANIEDYVVVPCVTIISDMPNRNGVSFPLETLLEWRVESGSQGYKTFKGKPTYTEHNNDNPVEAKGVILDSFLRKATNYGQGKVWKVIELLSFDRSKDSYLAKSILDGSLGSYSMGSYAEKFTCSVCEKDVGACHHIDPDRKYRTFWSDPATGRLVYKQVHGMKGFETSAVASPAFYSAISDKRMTLQDTLDI